MAVKPKRPAVESAELPAGENGAAVLPALSFEELADLSRENMAALTKANLAFSHGLQAISRELLGYARSSFERAGQTATALLGAKTLDEIVQVHTDLAKATLETMLQRSARLSEMSVSLANETLAPLGGRVEAAFARLTRPAA